MNFRICTRFMGTIPQEVKNARFDVHLDKKIEQDLASNIVKAKDHPGCRDIGIVRLPHNLWSSADSILKKYKGSPEFATRSTKLFNSIWSRHAPFEGNDLKERVDWVRQHLVSKGKIPEDENLDVWEPIHKERFANAVRTKVPKWGPIKYTTAYECALYMSHRLAPDYAALLRVFNEVKQKIPTYTPTTFFDFGSGVGSGMWAFNTVWPNTCKEAMFVDCSRPMNDFSRNLYDVGDLKCYSLKESGTFFRQFLPMSNQSMYDMVISSRSLFEIGQLEKRVQLVDVLWKKVNPGGCLVLIEAGSNAGYRLILEARDYLLQINEWQNSRTPNASHINICAPCPHALMCPRYNDKAKIPCNFKVEYMPLIGKNPLRDVFSYVVLHKAEKAGEEWPRIVDRVLHRNKHRIVRVCTPTGTLQEFCVTKKRHGKHVYGISRNSIAGDQFPVSSSYVADEYSSLDETDDSSDSESEK